ncbi:MAG: hypothetical protein K9H64_02820 [Bacteroidales bacterium]|nr:hypothetical protein [Bacteroidales bacterium]MCF8454828.1 hypothetical protein [Bacteroidales bacterium]
MNRLIVLILLFIWSCNLKADTPTKIYAHVQVHLKGGEKIECYFSNADYYLKIDSLSSTRYLTKNMLFSNFINSIDDSIVLYQNIIRIQNNYYIDETYQDAIIKLINPFLLAISKIDSISYLNHESAWGGYNVFNNLSISDSCWYNKKPLDVVQLRGSYYTYFILIHSNDSSLYSLLNLVEKDLKERDKYSNADYGENVGINQNYLEKLDEYEVVIIIAY